MCAYPILLVHGIDDSGARFSRMKAALVGRGLGPVRAMDIVPSDASISIEGMASQVRDAACALQRKTCAPRIDLVAFSMGALVARYFLQRQGGRSVVRRFISIAGPHHGTLIAYLRQNEGSRQMRPGSALLRGLNADVNPWGDVEVFSFWTPLDLMVIPATSSRLKGGA